METSHNSPSSVTVSIFGAFANVLSHSTESLAFLTSTTIKPTAFENPYAHTAPNPYRQSVTPNPISHTTKSSTTLNLTADNIKTTTISSIEHDQSIIPFNNPTTTEQVDNNYFNNKLNKINLNGDGTTRIPNDYVEIRTVDSVTTIKSIPYLDPLLTSRTMHIKSEKNLFPIGFSPVYIPPTNTESKQSDNKILMAALTSNKQSNNSKNISYTILLSPDTQSSLEQYSFKNNRNAMLNLNATGVVTTKDDLFNTTASNQMVLYCS